MMAPIHSHMTSGETSIRNVEAHGWRDEPLGQRLDGMSRSWKIVLSC